MNNLAQDILTNEPINWLWYQEGSREYYAVPGALCEANRLSHLITDIWIVPGSWQYRFLSRWYPRVTSRYTPAIPSQKVVHFNFPLLLFKMCSLLPWVGRLVPYDDLVSRFFANHLRRYHSENNAHMAVFCYNYIAYRLLREARKLGYRTVLGQIDAGPEAGKINREIYRRFFGNAYRPNPDLYTIRRAHWEEEIGAADIVVVNSSWSGKLLVAAGVDKAKIRIIPVPFRSRMVPPEFNRRYPDEFTPTRPLKVLFMGSIKPLKGIIPLIQAARCLIGEPVHFVMAGVLKMPYSALGDIPGNVTIISGGVPRHETTLFYRDADVFILPTFSDGFAITQLEAQVWKLPVITTPFCGEVVTHGVNGILLQEVSEQSLATALVDLLHDPAQLQKFSDQSIDLEAYRPGVIASRYLQLFG